MNNTDIFSIKSIVTPLNYDAIEVNAYNETINEVLTSKKAINEALARKEIIMYTVALHLIEGGIETIWMAIEEEDALLVAHEIVTTFDNLSNVSVNIEKTEEDTRFIHIYCYYSQQEEDTESESHVDSVAKEEYEAFQFTALDLYFTNHDTTEEPHAIWSE